MNFTEIPCVYIYILEFIVENKHAVGGYESSNFSTTNQLGS